MDAKTADELSREIEQLRWKHHQIDLDLGVSEDGVLSIDLISVPLEQQGRGLGTAAMGDVIALADRLGLAVRLEARSYQAYDPTEIGQVALERWYGRFGFQRTGEISDEGHPILLRAGHHLADDGSEICLAARRAL